MAKQSRAAEVAAIGRKRAYWNRTKGGVLITAELTGNDGSGVHWREMSQAVGYGAKAPAAYARSTTGSKAFTKS